MAVRDPFAAPYPQHTNGMIAVPFAALTAFPIPAGGPALKFNSWIEQIVINNPTAGALTLTIKDLAGNALLSAVSFAPAPAAPTVFTFPRPIKMVGGASWQASATGLLANLVAYYI